LNALVDLIIALSDASPTIREPLRMGAPEIAQLTADNIMTSTFRVGLSGLDNLQDVEGAVAKLAKALTVFFRALFRNMCTWPALATGSTLGNLPE
jgi:hypothetical protein